MVHRNVISLLLLILLTAFAKMVTSEVYSDENLEQFPGLKSGKRDVAEDLLSLLDDNRSCENLKPRSWCQRGRIFLSCKFKRIRKNCRAMCSRKCRG